MPKAEYEVKFLVRGMISVFVKAENRDAAINAAERSTRREFFRKKLNVIDERIDLSGIDNMTLWEKLDN